MKSVKPLTLDVLRRYHESISVGDVPDYSLALYSYLCMDGYITPRQAVSQIAKSLSPPAVPGEVERENAKLVELIKTRFLGVHPDELDCYLEHDDWTRIIAALSASPAQPVAIKPLEWRDHPIFGGDDLAIASIAEWGEHGHKYQVGRDADAPGYKAFLAPMHGSWFWTSPGHDTLEAAKAAAQSDYEARIRAALVGVGE